MGLREEEIAEGRKVRPREQEGHIEKVIKG